MHNKAVFDFVGFYCCFLFVGWGGWGEGVPFLSGLDDIVEHVFLSLKNIGALFQRLKCNPRKFCCCRESRRRQNNIYLIFSVDLSTFINSF